MQVFEWLMFLTVIALIAFVLMRLNNKKNYFMWGYIATLVFLILHLIFGYARWQLYPLYLTVLLLGVMVFLMYIQKISIKSWVRITILATMMVFVFLSGVLKVIFPMYTIAEPSGDYAIGTRSVILEDQDRLEYYSDEENDIRKIKIQFWYPAETVDGYELSPWLDDGVDIARGLSNDMGFPTFTLDHTAYIMSNAYEDAPISSSQDSYPVIVISHGWRGFRNVHTDYAEELASQGYIVVGIDHTYGSVATVFEDEVIYVKEEALPERETTPDFMDYANKLVSTYAGDVSFTIDYLEEINDSVSSSFFTQKLDLTRIGLLGHSTGGGADVKVALSDNRVDAIIGLDAWVEPITQLNIDIGLSIPSLFLRSETWETGYNNEKLYSLINQSTNQTDLYQIEGTTHFDFAMVDMYSPLTKYIGFSGDIDDEYLNDMLRTMVSNFFDQTLNNNQESRIDPNRWDEVSVIEPNE